MGFLDEIKKLTRPYDDEDDDFIEEDDAEAVSPASSSRAPSYAAPAPESVRRTASRNAFSSSYGAEPAAPSPSPSASSTKSNKVVNISGSSQMQVVLVKPERFETVAEIADHLREKRTVVMNLEQTNKEISRRLIDFLSGVVYAHEGKIKKIANSTYLITPYNVDLMGDLLDELESSGPYF